MTELKKFLSKVTPEEAGGVARSVVCTLGNGVKVIGCLDNYPAEIVERLAIHGLSQKLGDSTSSLQKERNFHGAFAAMSSVDENLRNGMWSSRAGGGTADLVVAIAKILKISEDEAQTKVDQSTEEQLTAIRKNPQVKECISKMQAERAKEAAKAAPKLEDLLSQLGMK